MTADELAALLAEDAVSLVDVRGRAEFDGATGYPCDPRQGHIEGAIHIDLDDLLGSDDPRGLLAANGVRAGRRLVLYCHSGSRSGIAVGRARRSGHRRGELRRLVARVVAALAGFTG